MLSVKIKQQIGDLYEVLGKHTKLTTLWGYFLTDQTAVQVLLFIYLQSHYLLNNNDNLPSAPITLLMLFPSVCLTLICSKLQILRTENQGIFWSVVIQKHSRRLFRNLEKKGMT
uniref:Uncharacterized protein n=1 Tax=Glossina brevipalpis TaxID=37001 RepID=A0A1A9WWI1_9MUSC